MAANPTGSLTFTLMSPGGGTLDTETVQVSGNGVYTTPTGYTLPAAAAVTGTYQWDVSYSGDANNNSASDNNDPTEQVAVSPAQPRWWAHPTRQGPAQRHAHDPDRLGGVVRWLCPDGHDHVHLV